MAMHLTGNPPAVVPAAEFGGDTSSASSFWDGFKNFFGIRSSSDLVKKPSPSYEGLPPWVIDEESKQTYDYLTWANAAEDAATALQFQRNEQAAQAQFERNLEADSTAMQRRVEDLKKAGINPILYFANGGSAGSVSSAAATATKPDYENGNLGNLIGSMYGSQSAKDASNFGSILGLVGSIAMVIGGIAAKNPQLIAAGATSAAVSYSGKVASEVTTRNGRTTTKSYSYYD